MKQIVPILDDKLLNEITRSVIMFSKKTEWAKLGMDRLREQGAALLLYGKPGTGKTLTARWLARKLRMGLKELDFGDIGSDTPGDFARNIKKLFDEGAVLDVNNNASMIFLDECDTMLVSRASLGHSALWMLEPINALLSAIGKYPGLVVLATNARPQFLDHALERRLIGSFEFGMPEYETRIKLWKAKWPRKLPIKLDGEQAKILAMYNRTGAEIENIIITWVSEILLHDKEWNLDDLYAILNGDGDGDGNTPTEKTSQDGTARNRVFAGYDGDDFIPDVGNSKVAKTIHVA